MLFLITNGFKNGSSVKLTFITGSKSVKRSYSFPSASRKEAYKFTSILKVLDILVKNHAKGAIATRRDIYYQDVGLFENQGVVDNIIDMLSKSLQLTPTEIGAIAAQKGLFFGNISTYDKEGVLMFDWSKASHTSTLIPRLTNVSQISLKDTDIAIIVEKEAVFTTLINSMTWGTSSSRSMIITGKGYPDLLTRDFVNLVISSNPRLQVFCLVDFDPYGISIMKQYIIGSKKASIHRLQTGSLIKLTNASILDFFAHEGVNALDISLRDFNLTKSMINDFEQTFNVADSDDLRILSECQRMMFFGKKAEIDSIETFSGGNGLVNYVEQCIR